MNFGISLVSNHYRIIVLSPMKKPYKKTAQKVDSSGWTRENIAWLSGLFEGEGCLSLRNYEGDSGPKFNIIIKMTDKDVIDRAKAVAGMGNITGPIIERHGTKPAWRWSVWGNERCVALAYAMFPYLHSRRRGKIAEMLSNWASLGREKCPQPELDLAA